MRHSSCWLAIALLATSSHIALAQNNPAPSPSTRAQDLEPAVDTSAPSPATRESVVDTSVAPPPSVLEPAVDTSADAPANDAAAPSQNTSAPAAGPRGRTTSRSGNTMDRLELDTTQITGNRELPKVLYIVPWKRSDLGDLLGKPVNSLLDEVLQPVDRDVFKRENRYFTALDSGQTPESGGAQTPPAPQAPR